MSVSSKKVLVKCLDYNGREVLFMMKSTDFRLDMYKENYIVLDAEVKYIAKLKRLVSSLFGEYTVFSDWSLRKV